MLINKSASRALKPLLAVFGMLIIGLAVLGFAVWSLTFHPAPVQPAPVMCLEGAKSLTPGQTIKIMSWNVQYMAGKNHWFFYEGGTDKAPTEQEVRQTLDEVARIIKSENPDIIMLQEIDEGAKRTHHMDQLKLLSDALGGNYPCLTEAFYWKARFVPHPKVMGPVGMKLVTLSKYKIASAKRYQLPLIPENWVFRQFNLKRALLEARIPFGGSEFIVINTHLSAFAQGTDTMEKQVAAVKSIMVDHSTHKRPWIAGGDFNLLPPGDAFHQLPPEQQSAYRPESEIKPLFEAFNTIPEESKLNGPRRRQWFSHFPNHPDIQAPNKTIDYIFYSRWLTKRSAHIRRVDTLNISDHLPVLAEFALPTIPKENE